MNVFKVEIIDPTVSLYKVKTFYNKKDAMAFLKENANSKSFGHIEKETSKKEKYLLGFPAYHGGRSITSQSDEYFIGIKKASYEDAMANLRKLNMENDMKSSNPKNKRKKSNPSQYAVKISPKALNELLIAVNSTNGNWKYPIGNKELTEKLKNLEHDGVIEYDEYYSKWVKSKRKKSNPSKSFDWKSKETILDLAKFFHEKFPNKTIKEIGKEIADSIDDNGRYSSYGDCAKVEVDGEEFNLIPNFDEFHSIAYDYVKQMLEDEPELFSKDWLNNHTYITDTDKRLLAGDEAETYTSNLSEDEIKEKYEEDYGEVLYDGGEEHISIGSYTVSYAVDGEKGDDIAYDYKDEEADKIAAEWHGGQFTELYKLSSSGMVDSKEDLVYEIEKCIDAVKKAPQNYDKGEEQRLDAFLYWAENEVEESEPDYDKMKEQIYDDHYDYVYGQLEEDPMNYFVNEIGVYSEEEYLKASFVSIDIDAATEDALRTDGEAHFLSHYDGNYEETNNGVIVMKE